jgi:hypothetical protein
MPKRITTIMLIALMCFSSASGFFTVLCHGSDGHVEVEVASHNHCQCPENDDNDHKSTPADHPSTALSASHDHCNDILLAPNILIPSRKNISKSAYKNFTANISLASVTDPEPSVFTTTPLGHKPPPFHTPLLTVVLLS